MMVERDPETGRFVHDLSSHMTGKQMAAYYENLRNLGYAINKAKRYIDGAVQKSSSTEHLD